MKAAETPTEELESHEEQESQEAQEAQALEVIRTFLTNSTSIKLNGAVTRSTPLLQGGLLDSLGILQLTMFLSETLGIEVTDEDYVPENFETVGSLVDFVVRKNPG